MSFHSRLMAKACSLVGSVDSNGAGGDEALRGDGGDPAVSFVVDQPQLAVVRLRGTDSACRGRCRTLFGNSCTKDSVWTQPGIFTDLRLHEIAQIAVAQIKIA